MCTWGDWAPENSQMKFTINYESYSQKSVICLLTWDEFKNVTPEVAGFPQKLKNNSMIFP